MNNSDSMLSVALVQMNSSDDLTLNYQEALNAIDSISRDRSVDLVIFPENFLNFGSKPCDSMCEQISLYIETFRQKAKSLKLNILLGTVPVLAPGTNKFFSRSYLLSARGELLTHYDKRHLFDVEIDDGFGSYRESDTYEPGGNVVVHQLEGNSTKLGLSICFDLRFSDHFKDLIDLGANVLVIPSAFTYVTGQAHWEVLLRARAIETQSYVLACNQVGEHSQGRQTYGHSMIIDPWGNVIANAAESVGICYGQLDLRKVSRVRKKMPLLR